MTRDERTYINLRPFRSRSLTDLESRIGPVKDIIRDHIQAGRRPVVLEVGHGFGAVLVELLMTFGDAIELHAISKESYWGSWQIIKENAARLGIADESSLRTLTMPILHVADVNDGLPFPSNSIDLVFSQATFYLFREKLAFISECSRVLVQDGVAKIDVHPLVVPDRPAELSTLLDLRIRRRSVEFWTFISQIEFLRRGWVPERGDYLEIRQSTQPTLPAKKRLALDLQDLNHSWFGTKTIYDVDPDSPCARTPQ